MTVILGIDPGSRITGYGLIEEKNRHLYYVDSGCIRTTDGSLSGRLLRIYDSICQLMENYQPDEVAIEQVFVHQNPDSALKLGHARGAALVAAASHRIKIAEYSAREVKQSVVGYGAAQKEQVSHMVVQLLSLSNRPQNDAADALAIAICHSHMRNGLPLVMSQRKPRRRRSQ
ncbi:crossover junction endodeoxyribonuclease RuvC [Legionella israelensis]|uniref:Crossover junction endodeoxyribonuclease RuvC n=1 Tax=Legionella israelensis TaxID=454 RepID=A0A0W0VHD9_9GAMM|nr:crossover junction endodeoxyribonuclease RuvC [Legionella israelensis]KTD19498.1 Holliday junction resolvase [Legionella israelensis]QBR84392.1 crossover junction endodeoxyribonuclease RuvC [Legionella israelensis]QBS08666.1 crossover junction endodeoxyribonuclease RuvC [Legionella israelensis]QDP72500.1 crossover junction endodeoxyribonuclease RuvC [Legionella israelensis]SCY46164.1 Holliday junction endonuclease RuvC [Legionella israelensis DSM 19235]